jgi:zinc protease
MSLFFAPRAFRYPSKLIASVAAAALLVPVPMMAKEKPALQQVQPQQGSDWLYAGSDIPRDAGWIFGTLPNGLRYAVRNNEVPPGQVAIRVRMDVGSLHESNEERGYAHLLEHLSFRGSAYIPDGEAKRIWQRFGVTFGSDSNALTTPTQTVYKLDLPSATETSLDDTIKLLSGMMRAPAINNEAVRSERGVTMAELRENDGPQSRISDALIGHMMAGTLLADRRPIGTVESLAKAEAGAVSAFHNRWYRPERAVIVVSGDGDPQKFVELIKRHFGDWKGKGANPNEPQTGKLDRSAPEVRNIVEAGQPVGLSLAWVRPWVKRVDTLDNSYRLYMEYLAQALVNRRLENQARRGGSFLVATASQEYTSRIVDTTLVNIVPVGDWKAALADTRGVIADALRSAPSQAEIDREANEIAAYLRKELENARNEPGARLADDLVNSVDINEVVASPQTHVGIFEQVRKRATPEQILEITRALYQGEVQRLVMISPTPVEGGEAALQAALDAPVTPIDQRLSANGAKFTDLPSLGAAGRVLAEQSVPGMRLQQLHLSNGVRAMVADNEIEPGKVRVRVRFGSGYRSQTANKPNLLWSGDYALVASGVGPWGLNEMDEAMNGRQIQMKFTVEDDAFELSAESSTADIVDQLNLMAQKLANPRWDKAPVERMRVSMLTGYELAEGTPNAVLDAQLRGLVSAKDGRWMPPTKAELEALTPEAFQAFWQPLLASGPIEVQLFGDLRGVDYRALLAQTFGALPQRQRIEPSASATVRFPKPNSVADVVYHRGDATQAAAVMAWPTSGGYADVRDSRVLEVLASIFNDRLFDRLRSEQGSSYSPMVQSFWPTGFEKNGGYLMALSLVANQDVAPFYDIVDDIAADLVAQPVSDDELNRHLAPLREQLMRASTGNAFWQYMLRGATQDARVVQSTLSIEADYGSINAADIQRLAARYLLAKAAWKLAVLPQGMTMDQVEAAGQAARAARPAPSAAAPTPTAPLPLPLPAAPKAIPMGSPLPVQR